MISRRQFVAMTLHSAAYISLTDTVRASGLMRIGTITDAERPELDAGLAFGAAEANRSALLFNWRVEREEMSASGFSADVHALVVSRDFHPSTAAMPTFNASCIPLPLVQNVFTVADCRRHETRDTSRDRRVVLWHHSLARYGADALNNRYRTATGVPMTSDAWLGWFSMKVLAEAALRTKSSHPATLLAYLRQPTSQFDGHKGAPLRFDGDGRLRQPVYVIRKNAESGEWLVEREVR